MSTAVQEREGRWLEWVWFFLALGVAVRFLGLDWDRGLMFNPDEGNIGRAAAALTFPDGLVSDFSAYNGLALYLPRVLAELMAALGLGPPVSPSTIISAGRLISALFASLTLPLLTAIARRLWGIETALFVAAVAAFTPALIQSAHFATTEAALILCVAALLWLTLRHMSGEIGLVAYGLLVGLVIGLGFGFKTTALVFAIVPAVAVTQTSLLKGRIWATLRAGAIAVAVLAALAFVTTPQIWATPGAYFDTMKFEAGVVAGTEDVFWTYQFTQQQPVIYELIQLPWLLGPLLPVLSAAGLALALVGITRGRSGALFLAPAAAFTVVYFVVISSWYAKFVRYEYPLLPTLLLFAGYALAVVRRVQLRRVVALAVVLVTGAAGFIQLLVYLNPDPRIAAWDWLAPQLTADQHVLIEPHDVGSAYWVTSTPISIDVLPLLEPSRIDKLQNMASLLSDGAWMIVASRRHHAVLPRMRARFPETCGYYDALWSGRLGYEVVGRFTRRPPLPAALSPELWAEETFTVFDSPEVFVLRNIGDLSSTDLLAQIEARSATCAGANAPTPPR